jgi:hypothetical protein
MRRCRALAVAPLLLALAGAPPASAGDSVVGQISRPSAVRTFAGIQVFSAFDGTAYRLAIRRHGMVEQLPVAPSRTAFDVDIGPDRTGRPELIYSRCESDCDLFVLSLAAGGAERPLRTVNTSADEIAPTLWKGSVAFARGTLFGPGREIESGSRAVVYTKELSAPRSRPAERLPGVPRHDPFGGRVRDGAVNELELHGDRLGQIVSFYSLDGGQRSQVRLVDVTMRTAERLANVGVGEGGQYFTGVSFAGGYVAWVYGWLAGGGELIPGIYRDRLSSGELSRARFPAIVDREVFGFALFAADGAYMSDAQLESGEGCGSEAEFDPPIVRQCQLIRSAPLDFRPTRQPSASHSSVAARPVA